jgi:serine protease Do
MTRVRIALLLLLLGPLGTPAKLTAKELPTMGWLGVQITDVGEELADRLAVTFGYAAGTGVQVVDVLPGGPAEQARLQRGDVIVAMDAQPIWEVRQLQHRIRQAPADHRIMLTVLRGSARIRLPVTIAAMPLSARAQLAGERFGLIVREAIPAAAAAEGHRVVVAFVDPESPASRAGVRPLDVILEANQQPVHDLDEFAGALFGDHLSLVLERRDSAPVNVTLDRPR